MKRVSVIIPVKNGEATLGRCLSSIRKQSIAGETEIIVLDSMSTDASREIAAQYDARIVDVHEGTFNHGLTRNVGVHESGSELIYFTVQDAWIPESDMLEKMAGHFIAPDIMAVVGHQAIPHEKDKNPFYWYRPYSKPEITLRFADDKEVFLNLPAKEQRSLVAWDDVVSMYRKNALVQQPFVKTEFSEDWIWSYNALLKGWKLLHDPSLIVYHYHHQSYRYAFNLTYAENYHFYTFFNYKPSLPSFIMPMARISYHLLKNEKLSFSQKLYWIIHNASGKLGNYFSTINFLVRLKTGGRSGIERGYNKYCASVPQGRQKAPL